MEYLKNVICTVLTVGILLMTGCGGRQAYPVQITQPGDYRMGCNQLEGEMSRIRYEIQNKSGQKSQGDNKDTALFVAGMLLFWPSLFFMDLSNSDKVELEALRSRYNHLTNVYNSKDCN